MYKTAKPLFLICETPLHAGSGSDLGIVDLPIQRERHTSFPKIEASSLKGALREACEFTVLKPIREEKKTFEDVKVNLKNLNRVFGFDKGALKGVSEKQIQSLFDEQDQSFAGCIGFSDARLLLFPIKSMKGVFAWVTCPKVLQQFQSDMGLAKVAKELDFSELEIEENQALVTKLSSLAIANSSKIVLEDYAFNSKQEDIVDKLGEWLASTIFEKANSYVKKKIQADIVILSDDDFKDFVNLSTEVITRTKIDNETGTVADGQLFTEEYLPAESVMYSLVLTADEFSSKEDKMQEEQVQSFFKEQLPTQIQIGANATIGKGLTRTYFN